MRKLLLLGVLLVGASALAAGAYAALLWGRMQEVYRGYDEPERFVEIPQGMTPVAIGRRLVEAGVVRDELAFRAALWWADAARQLQAGEYRFDAPLSAVGVVDLLVAGRVFEQRVTFPEGLTIEEMAGIYESGGFGPAEAFVEAAGDPAPIAELDPEAPDLEGYLFPETYSVPRRVPAARLVGLMVDRFTATFSDALRTSAASQGLSVREVVALASLIEKETARADERSLVSAVYRNRMRIGMGMQADPTVVYALRKAGRYDGNIRRVDLQLDSPYNTYRYPGLPPGPIAAPGRAALEAALAPADVPYLYFVSRNDGSHVFARTLAEHNRNVREFQVLFFRNQRQREAAGGR
ncbi:MAG: endolytic transglycosylase MltG [Acidobacteria bacterium]|nr:endolytic transglycosylase MltG [Acidobacteriota bacterium]